MQISQTSRWAVLFGRMGGQWQKDERQALLLILPAVLTLLAHLSNLPVWASAVLLSLTLWRVLLILNGKRLPNRWVLMLVTATLVGAVFSEYKTLVGRDSGVTLLLLMLGLKQLELRARRDTYIVLLLCFFAIFSVLFYSQSLLMALYLMLCVYSTIIALISVQYHALEASLKQTLKLSAKLFLSAVPVAVVLFVFFPRLSQPLWALPNSEQKAKTGMSDEMRVGDISQLALSDEVAFRVKFQDQMPMQSKLYWRGLVLDGYDGRRWFSQYSINVPKTKIVPKNGAAVVNYQMTLEPTQARWVFALEAPLYQTIQQTNLVFNASNLVIQTKERTLERIQLSLQAVSDYSVQMAATKEQFNTWLSLPKGVSPQSVSFARQLRQQSFDERDFLEKILKHFRMNSFSYTLEPPTLGEHGVDDFLFKTRAGFCEHYSQAFVFLARAAGIPARVVIGYQGGEYNPIDGTLVVRQADAHAWTEVWLKEEGWVRFDPTAAVDPARVDRSEFQDRREKLNAPMIGNVSTAWITPLRHAFEAMNNAWAQWVVNYDFERQGNVLKQFGFKNPTSWHLAIMLVVILCTTLIWIAWRTLRDKKKVDSLEYHYQLMLKFIELRYQRKKMASQGALHFCHELREVLSGDHYELFEEATHIYYRLRYTQSSKEESKTAIAYLRVLSKQFKTIKPN